jgi:hypothetical protein
MAHQSLAIILPVHDEVGSLGRVVSEWDSSLRKIPGLNHTFVTCEDGSTDGTKELIIDPERRYPVLNNSVLRRRGYAQAVRNPYGGGEITPVAEIVARQRFASSGQQKAEPP